MRESPDGMQSQLEQSIAMAFAQIDRADWRTVETYVVLRYLHARRYDA